MTHPRWLILQRKVNEELEDLWEVDRYLKALKAERGMLDTEVHPSLSGQQLTIGGCSQNDSLILP